MTVVRVVLLAVLLELCWKTPCAEGVEFFLDGVMTNGPVSVTAVGIFGTADDTPLICQSEVAGTAASQNWYLHPDQQSTAASDRIESNGDRGWRRTRETTTDGFSQVLLRRISASVTALEGVFTCEITGTGDSNPIRSLSVLYPISSVTASVVVVSARDGEFRVQCSSTGGRALSMTVTGPGVVNSDLTSNIQPVGTPVRMGDDDYRATTSDIITGGSDGDEYECTATGSTSDTDSVQLRVAAAPIIESLERTAPDTVRVVWSQPTGGAPVTDYIIHYTDSSGSAGTEAADAGSTSTDIIVPSTPGETYTISVEARSDHLSGESGTMTIYITFVPGPVGGISSVSSFFMITITWDEPEMPNGIITKYKVVYGPTASPQSSGTENETTERYFTTPDDLERGTEYTFTVTALTSVGPGQPTSINVSTLDRPPAVEGVMVVSLSGTSAMVSWDALIIPGHPIDTYTVVYSPVSQRRKRQEEEEEEEMVFPGTVTSAVITGLDSSVNYQFQVFATVTVNGQTLEGERSTTATTVRDFESSGCASSSSPFITGVIIAIIGVLVY